MKKKLLACLVACTLLLSLTGCTSDPVQVNVSNDENIASNQFGEFRHIGDDLVYDTATRIVYIENYAYPMNDVYTPYYAPNGLPYKYDPETSTFEEINQGETA